MKAEGRIKHPATTVVTGAMPSPAADCVKFGKSATAGVGMSLRNTRRTCPRPLGREIGNPRTTPRARAWYPSRLIRPAVILLLFCLLPSSFCLTFAASLTTLDGKTYEGEIKLEPAGQISIITTEGAKPQKLNLNDILQATFGGQATKPTKPPRVKPNPETGTLKPATLKEGIMLRSGTFLAATQTEKADDGTIFFLKSNRRESASIVNVARIVFREIGPDLIAKIPENRTGVLLREGDFVEGEFKSLSRGRIQLSSVLFGLTNFDIRDKAVALVLGDVEPIKAELLVRTIDGSTYAAKSLTPDKDTLIITESQGQRFTVNRWDVSEISAGTTRMESLADIKPTKIEPKGATQECLSINSTGAGVPMTLAGITFTKGLTLTAGTSATWNINGKYRTLSFKAGVPQSILPTAAVRFVVLADNKELYKSKPRTSQDDPLAASLSIKDTKTITLKVESTSPDLSTTPGLWGDVGLVK